MASIDETNKLPWKFVFLETCHYSFSLDYNSFKDTLHIVVRPFVLILQQTTTQINEKNEQSTMAQNDGVQRRYSTFLYGLIIQNLFQNVRVQNCFQLIVRIANNNDEQRRPQRK